MAAKADKAGWKLTNFDSMFLYGETPTSMMHVASLIPLSVGTGTDTLFGAIALATAGGTIAGTLGLADGVALTSLVGFACGDLAGDDRRHHHRQHALESGGVAGPGGGVAHVCL